MAPVKTNDVLQVPAYSQDSESAATEISWSQNLRDRTARYYIVQAKNTSQNNEDVPLYVQDRFYKDQDSNDFIGKLPGARREGDNWVVPIGDRFQYGQKDDTGKGRWVCLHDKENKPYQHRFLVTTLQGRAAQWIKNFAVESGAKDIADPIHKIGSNFLGDYLHTF